jgi:hypothetical protein
MTRADRANSFTVNGAGPAWILPCSGEMNRIVARFLDGRLMKGFTADFLPTKGYFHITLEEQGAGAKPVEVHVPDLKALFFVKTLDGDPQHHKCNEPGSNGSGRRLRIVFKDGEVMVGTTQGYDRSRSGFFVIPVDSGGNNERCFIVAAATSEVTLL